MPRPATLKSADELAQVGLSRHRRGELEAAEQSYRAALARDDRHLAALTLLATILLEKRQNAEAAPLLERAVALAPEQAMLHSNHGEALRRLGRNDEALAAFARAVELEPDKAQLHYNLALVLDQMGRPLDAVPEYQRALRLEPALPGCLLLYLAALRDAGQCQRALDEHARLGRRAPESAPLLCCLASIHLELFHIDEAARCYERALTLEPNAAEAHAGLALALSERGEADRAIENIQRALQLEPDSATYRSNLCYLLHFSTSAAPSDVLAAAREYGRRHADATPRMPLAARGSAPQRGRQPLRVGYVSPDFRQHPVASFMRPLLRAHDPDRVEVFCYSSVRRPDATSAELQQLAPHWRDIASFTDEVAAQLIAQDRIDILVDLAQHGAGHRLGIFARKPAPVQISWLGYPGTTGVAAIDYRLTDPQLDPPELGDDHSSEALVRLPRTFWCYEAPCEHEIGELPAIERGYVTFGSLNSCKKLSEVCLQSWARILRAIPDAKLLTIAPEGKARERIHELFATSGVEPSRVEMRAPMSRDAYYRTYQELDIALDPAPYGGGTTSLDALWMGVPLITRRGALAVGRSGASLLHNLGLARELVASTDDEVVELATGLAGRRDRLAQLRRELRARMLSSPLMDAPAFARGLESTFYDLQSRSIHP